MIATDKKLLHPKYRPDVDGLRAVAVISVVAFHAFPNLVKGGFIGVDVFFVISGFLIATIIFKSLDNGSFSFSEFYSRRIKRIFPSLLLVLAACLFFGWLVLLPEELNQLGKHIFYGSIFASNFILWSEVGYFDNAAETKPLLHLWSLGIEEQFYIVWPLLLFIFWKRGFNLLALTLIFAALSLSLNLVGIKADSVATFFSPLTRFWELLLGSGLAWLALYRKNSLEKFGFQANGLLNKIVYRDSSASNGTLQNLISFLGLFLLVYGFWRINTEVSFPGGWALIPVLGAVLIISAGSQAWINKNILSNPVFVWFGLISFPLYLWHWPILSFARIIENEIPDITIRIAAVFASVLLAWLTTRFIEKPFRFSAKNSSGKLRLLVVAMVLLCVAGFYTSKSDFSQTHGYEKLLLERKGFEHAFGFPLSWYRGKDDWLFLGNAYENTVAKAKGAIQPAPGDIDRLKDIYSKIAQSASAAGAQTVLLIGPNKSSIYTEYLPDEMILGDPRYIDMFKSALGSIPGLNVFDPTSLLHNSKKSDEFLYWRTDTHWNQQGAFIAYQGLLDSLAIPAPDVAFSPSFEHYGDLIDISQIDDFPVTRGDNFEFGISPNPDFSEHLSTGGASDSFGSRGIVLNNNPVSDKYIWVIGDSFSAGLRPYLNSTFREINYLGHWAEQQESLPEKIAEAERKPDLIFIVRVERSF